MWIKGLIELQNELKAPKNQYNSFGKYKYRSAEDILEALKPLLLKYQIQMTTPQVIESSTDGLYDYIKTTVVLEDAEGHRDESITGYARVDNEKKGMDGAQITGAASSYSKKYALCNAFLIDDTKDSDTEEYQSQAKQQTKAAPKAQAKPKAVTTSKVNQAMSSMLEHFGGDKQRARSEWDSYGGNLTDAQLDIIIEHGQLI